MEDLVIDFMELLLYLKMLACIVALGYVCNRCENKHKDTSDYSVK